jgi:hypothetical protein
MYPKLKFIGLALTDRSIFDEIEFTKIGNDNLIVKRRSQKLFLKYF